MMLNEIKSQSCQFWYMESNNRINEANRYITEVQIIAAYPVRHKIQQKQLISP